MPKPYPVLAAALAASARSLSTVTLAAPGELSAFWTIRDCAEWAVDAEGASAFNLEGPIALDPFAEQALAQAAALFA